MEINFSIHETPKPKGSEKQTSAHARIQPNGTKRLEDICLYINEVSSLSSSDVKGALEALFKYLSLQLQSGYNVELDGFGHFSVALRSQKIADDAGKEKIRTTIDGVNFRCSPRLKSAVKNSRLKKVKRPSSSFPQIAQRQERLVEYLEKHEVINQRQYTSLNGCSRYMAGKDLKKFREEGLITCSGRTTHKVYLLVE